MHYKHVRAGQNLTIIFEQIIQDIYGCYIFNNFPQLNHGDRNKRNIRNDLNINNASNMLMFK